MLVLLGGMLFLPEVAYFDAPLVPPVGKHEIAAGCALLGLLVRSPGRLRLPRLGRGADFLLILVGVSGTITVFLNHDAVSYGPLLLPGTSARDVLSFGIRDVFDVLLPYLVGRMCIQSTRDVRALLRVVLGLGLVYSLLIMFELRFSPNLHRWIYGYHAREDFSQTIRWGGYRPTVFMEHGLAVALLAMVVALVAAVQSRLHKRHWGLPSWCWALYFTVIMILCRGTGAILLGSVALVAILWTSPRKQLRLAALIAAICLIYPCLRFTGIFPKDTIVNVTSSVISPDRAASIKVRFDNEDLLMDHVDKRLWFGWGGNGRNRLYDSEGNDAVITDGHWIILLSVGRRDAALLRVRRDADVGLLGPARASQGPRSQRSAAPGWPGLGRGLLRLRPGAQRHVQSGAALLRRGPDQPRGCPSPRHGSEPARWHRPRCGLGPLGLPLQEAGQGTNMGLAQDVKDGEPPRSARSAGQLAQPSPDQERTLTHGGTISSSLARTMSRRLCRCFRSAAKRSTNMSLAGPSTGKSTGCCPAPPSPSSANARRRARRTILRCPGQDAQWVLPGPTHVVDVPA
jgi:hypothetical protein